MLLKNRNGVVIVMSQLGEDGDHKQIMPETLSSPKNMLKAQLAIAKKKLAEEKEKLHRAKENLNRAQSKLNAMSAPETAETPRQNDKNVGFYSSQNAEMAKTMFWLSMGKQPQPPQSFHIPAKEQNPTQPRPLQTTLAG